MILIVDDDKTTVQTVSVLLEEDGYKVFGCYDGNSALEQVRKIKPRVVLLDYNLPDIDGLLVLKKFRKTKDNIKVIIISGTSDPEVEKRTNKAGAFAYLRKPFDPEKLLIMIKKAVKEGPHGKYI